MKIVVLSPHRDDAAFSLGLTIQSWIDSGHSVQVVNCFTRSEYAPYSHLQFLEPKDRMAGITALRSREDLRWSQVYAAGLTLTDLNLVDAPLRLACTPEEVCTLDVTPGDEIFSKIQEVVDRESTAALVLPLALGRHVDHQTVREAAMPAHGSARPYAFYEDLPYAARPGAATTIPGIALAIDRDLAPVFAQEETDLHTAIARKRRVALCYDSQIEQDGIEKVAQFCKRYGGRERLWANALWRASDLGVPGKNSEALV